MKSKAWAFGCIVASCAAMLVGTCGAAEAARPAADDAVRAARRARIHALYTVRIPKPGTGRGRIAFVADGAGAEAACVAAAAAQAAAWVSESFGVHAGTNALAGDTITVSAGHYGAAARLVVLPDARVARINLDALLADRPDAARLAGRVLKEQYRGCAYLLGSGVPKDERLLLAAHPTLASLDAAEGKPQVGMCFVVNGDRMGFEPYESATYRDACRAGWAPAPQDEFERKMYEREQARRREAQDPAARWRRDKPAEKRP